MTIKSNNAKYLSGINLGELEEVTKRLGWPKFKSQQIFDWIYKKPITSIDDFSNLSKKERDLLKSEFSFSPLELEKKEVSTDKTIKYLWELKDKNFIESVRMVMDDDSHTVCISSQAGCAVGCPFCATATLKLKRNLTAPEIVEQILNIQRDTKERVRNIVFMGQGEPLNNYDEVIKSIYLIRSSVGIGARHITLSTSGIAPKIKKLAEEKLPITLALSLHAPDQRTREILVPISKKYKMDELMDSVYYFYERTKRRITIEYVMLEGINDQIEKAKELSDLLKDLHCHVNLIPYNPVKTKDGALSIDSSKLNENFQGKDKNNMLILKRPSNLAISKFKEILEKKSRKRVTVRQERGTDINAACGQLANSIRNNY